MKNKSQAFTLIELLIVIAIIALVAGLLVGAAQHASIVKKNTRVTAIRSSITTMIEEYKSTLNFYPPDNASVATASTTAPSPTQFSAYEGYTATNPLIYELTGATNANGVETVFLGNTLTTAQIKAVFGRQGFANGDAAQPHDFFVPAPQTNDYAVYQVINSSTQVYGLTVPVDLIPGSSAPNFLHYDASSPHRHNPNSYDLWAEYEVGRKNGAPVIITNGNW